MPILVEEKTYTHAEVAEWLAEQRCGWLNAEQDAYAEVGRLVLKGRQPEKDDLDGVLKAVKALQTIEWTIARWNDKLEGEG